MGSKFETAWVIEPGGSRETFAERRARVDRLQFDQPPAAQRIKAAELPLTADSETRRADNPPAATAMVAIRL